MGRAAVPFVLIMQRYKVFSDWQALPAKTYQQSYQHFEASPKMINKIGRMILEISPNNNIANSFCSFIVLLSLSLMRQRYNAFLIYFQNFVTFYQQSYEQGIC